MTLQEFKDTLGDDAKDLSEEEIIELKNSLEQMVELCWDAWLEEKVNKKHK